MIKAAILDMDGLLIDSEPLWRQAEKVVFRSVGIDLIGEMFNETLGLRIDETVSHWYKKFPWSGPNLKEVESELLTRIQELIVANGKALRGVFSTLDTLRDAGIQLGIASSSPPHLIETVVDKLGIRDYFSVMNSATNELMGKPAPAVYLSAAKGLGVSPENCLAFEDSVSGVKSAKSAGMLVVAVPDERHFSDVAFDLADIKLHSLEDFSLDVMYGLCNRTRTEKGVEWKIKPEM